MPNQDNFRSSLNKEEPRFLASRIVRLPEENILLEQIPGSFGYDGQDYVEVHFYNIPENELVASLITKLSDNTMKLNIVKYADESYKTHLQLDFTKMFLDNGIVVVPGDYRVALNFFSDEIGGYTDRRLSITQISPNRTEVELEFNNETEAKNIQENNILLREFIYKGFNRSDAAGIIQKIFEQGVELNDPREGVHIGNVEQNLTVPEKGITQTKADTLDLMESLGIRSTFDQQVNEYIYNLFEKIQEEIIIKGDDRVQQDEMYAIIERAVKENISQLQTVVDSRIKVS